MNTKSGPSLIIVALGITSMGAAILLSTGTQQQWVNHGIATVISAGLLAVVASVRQWSKFAWAPVLGMTVASAGVVAGFTPAISAGYLLTVILTLLHGYQVERPRRAGAPATA